MSISSIGNSIIDYSRNSSRQIEQQTRQESEEQQTEQAATVQASAQSAASSGAGTSGQLAGTLSEDEDSDQALINKANAGSALTQSELSRLKEADPVLYARAVKAEEAREELRVQMKQNPSEAKQAMRSAVSRNNDEGQELVRKALANEYSSFTSKYDLFEQS
jgi:hypothetical protein